MQQPSLYRSNQNKMISGVMGGIAQRFGWNANLLRLIFVAVSVMSAAFPGILVYLILWMIIPKQAQLEHSDYTAHSMRTVHDEQQSKY